MRGWENFDPNAQRRSDSEARRSHQGAVSRRFGVGFEQYIKEACEHYSKLRIADIEKTPEPMKVLRPIPGQPGRFLACFESPAQPDFKGTLHGGRSIVFDAKATQAERIEQRVVSDEQRRSLEQHYELGAACFIIVTLNLQGFYRVPWDVWRRMRDYFGHRYMSAVELEPFRVPVKNGIIQFLNGMPCTEKERGES